MNDFSVKCHKYLLSLIDFERKQTKCNINKKIKKFLTHSAIGYHHIQLPIWYR